MLDLTHARPLSTWHTAGQALLNSILNMTQAYIPTPDAHLLDGLLNHVLLDAQVKVLIVILIQDRLECVCQLHSAHNETR